MIKKDEVIKTTFDEYIVVEQEGSGGNGTVFHVKNGDLKDFALKIISRNNTSREKLKRFKNEINFCEKYNNENIIKVIDRGIYANNAGEYSFYVMPLYKGSLRKYINPYLEISKAIDLFLKVCNGLKFAHSKGCIHRDLKPENILLSNGNECVVADFGIAHFIDSDKLTTIETKETSRLANFTYHAPEQIKGEATYATDIFALGLILNEMVTGVVPVGANYKRIADVNIDYAFLDDIVQKMISQEPTARYQSIDELLLDFEARKANAETQRKIAQLKTPLLMGEIHDSITDDPIKIINVDIRDNNLVLMLNNYVNADWKKCYYGALSNYNSFPYCYLNVTFIGKEIEAFIDAYNVNSLDGLIADIKNAIDKANRKYASMLVMKVQKAHAEAVKMRQEEIKQIEKEMQIINKLKKLI